MLAPLYLTPPSTKLARVEIRAGRLGAITTPSQGNRLEEGWWFCVDNGCFTGSYPGDEDYLLLLKRLRHLAPWCLFVVAPDVPGNHFATLARSRDMLPRIRDLGFPAAYAAQNLMDLDTWDPWDEIDCLFIGGTDAWKLGRSMATLAAVASSYGRWVHMGRVNSLKRYRYAAAIGCDSVDGTYLVQAPDKNLPDLARWRADVELQDPLLLPEIGDFFDQSYLRVPRRRPASSAGGAPVPYEVLF